MKKAKAPTSPKLSKEEIGRFCFAMAMAPRQLRLVAQRMTEAHSLGPRGVWILGLIQAAPLFPLDLTNILQIGRSLVSAELNRLVEAGLIVASKSADDGRRIELALTPLGKVVEADLTKEITKLMQGKLASYTHEEVMLCTRMLRDFCDVEA